VCTCNFSDCGRDRRVFAHVALDPQCLFTLWRANIQRYGSGTGLFESIDDCRANAPGTASNYGYLTGKL
jgi:hypothetical protein